MARRNQHSREALSALAVQAVRELVAEQGLARLSVRKVAERIGYTPGMLYHLFANQDELILHANAETLALLLAAMDRAAALPPADALRTMAHQYLGLAQEQAPLWQMVFSHRMQRAAPVPDWYRQRTAALFSRVEAQMARLCPGRDTDAVHVAARTLWSSVHGVCVLAVEDKLDVAGDVDPAAMLDSLIHHYLASWARGETS
ncbi:TetR/AcrR family transcriptional regulator [Isoalcanivorax indicus]|uniref:TetR/AcrR family transcriptional regulator n=1 Tax=Isoalcanivorax indicus TaxID=2202653 RepID=UPI000DBAC7F1|nr:TetR/AcrR family transcriptional regulator [Isoalcanivorax indicus]